MFNYRNQCGTLADLDQEIASQENLAGSALREAQADPDYPWQDGLLEVQERLLAALRCRYVRGDSAEELAAHFRTRVLPDLVRTRELTLKYFPDAKPEMGCLHTDTNLLLLALACFDTDGQALSNVWSWFANDQSSALFNLLARAFAPGHAYPKKFKKAHDAASSENPVARAVLLPPPDRSKALEAFVRKWPALMAAQGSGGNAAEGILSTYFPFHAALAACAYDIDDSALRELPAYPARLVDYYRSHVRHQRDAWRAMGAGAGDDLPAPLGATAPAKKPTAAAAYTRWIELVCEGSPPLVAHARKALGSRKTMPELFCAMEALAGAGLALQADIKDDATIAQQVMALCATRGWTGFVLPDEPAQGPGRISAIVSALHPWLAQHGQRLALLGEGSDAWQGVVYKASDDAEFTALCEQLQIDIVDE